MLLFFSLVTFKKMTWRWLMSDCDDDDVGCDGCHDCQIVCTFSAIALVSDKVYGRWDSSKNEAKMRQSVFRETCHRSLGAKPAHWGRTSKTASAVLCMAQKLHVPIWGRYEDCQRNIEGAKPVPTQHERQFLRILRWIMFQCFWSFPTLVLTTFKDWHNFTLPPTSQSPSYNHELSSICSFDQQWTQVRSNQGASPSAM